MNVYPLAVDAFLRGEINMLADTVKGQLLGAYTYNPAHADTSDLTGLIGPPVTITVDRVEQGTVWLTDPLEFTAPAGPNVTAMVAYIDGGPLLAHIDRRADTVPFSIVPTGGTVTLTFDRLFKL
jgi:hypothetical protein